MLKKIKDVMTKIMHDDITRNICYTDYFGEIKRGDSRRLEFSAKKL